MKNISMKLLMFTFRLATLSRFSMGCLTVSLEQEINAFILYFTMVSG